MYYNKRCKTFCIVINNVLIIVINILNTTIFEPVILTSFYTTKLNKISVGDFVWRIQTCFD